MEQEPWVGLETVAKHVDVSQDTIRRWIKDRGMPATKVGRAYRFKLSAVDEWMQTHEASGQES